ncbi:hypothetical protein HK101_006731 [Irineochytrium annulatum]|nr:hypothetical protein HK101_006731 [Irineochytrium annulatum]
MAGESVRLGAWGTEKRCDALRVKSGTGSGERPAPVVVEERGGMQASTRLSGVSRTVRGDMAGLANAFWKLVRTGEREWKCRSSEERALKSSRFNMPASEA